MAARIPGTTPEQLKLIAEDMRTRMLGQRCPGSQRQLESLRSMISKQKTLTAPWPGQSNPTA
jgi:hypothetical protein